MDNIRKCNDKRINALKSDGIFLTLRVVCAADLAK